MQIRDYAVQCAQMTDLLGEASFFSFFFSFFLRKKTMLAFYSMNQKII